MRDGTGFGRGSLGIVILSLFEPLALGQLPPRLERCLPYPTLADEIHQTKAEKEAQRPPPRDVLIDSISFQGPSPVPRAIQELMISAIRRQPLHDYSGWVDELAEVIVQGSFLENGYFRADASAKAELLSQTGSLEHFALIVRVAPGPQYRLGTVQFRSADPDQQLAFPTEELRALVPLRDGDIFNVMKLRQAINSLHRLYGTSGWIDFTAEPKLDVDDAAKRIDLTLQLDQEKQYRVGNVDIWGENSAAERIVRSMFKAGEILDDYLIDRFYAENKAILPADASPEYDVKLTKDVKKGIVNIRFDFRTCPVASE